MNGNYSLDGNTLLKENVCLPRLPGHPGNGQNSSPDCKKAFLGTYVIIGEVNDERK